MPRFDYRCENPDCQRLEQNVHVSTANVLQTRACLACGFDMMKLPSAPNFAIKGYRASNGYSHK